MHDFLKVISSIAPYAPTIAKLISSEETQKKALSLKVKDHTGNESTLNKALSQMLTSVVSVERDINMQALTDFENANKSVLIQYLKESGSYDEFIGQIINPAPAVGQGYWRYNAKRLFNLVWVNFAIFLLLLSGDSLKETAFIPDFLLALIHNNSSYAMIFLTVTGVSCLLGSLFCMSQVPKYEGVKSSS